MFTKDELKTLRSCWVLPDGKLWSVPAEAHDRNLPDGYYNDDWDVNKSIDEVEKTCFRMSFWWGWDAEISQMTIACKTLTEEQQQIILYLLVEKIITPNKIEAIGDHWKNLTDILVKLEQQAESILSGSK